MKYTVTWLPGAEDELASLWLDADDRDDVTVAADEIDRQLRVAPEALGESRSNDLRVMFVPPLGVLFAVSLADLLVTVIHVWRS